MASYDVTNGNYLLQVGGQTASVRSSPDPDNPGMVRIEATGSSGTSTTHIAALFSPVNPLLEYVAFIPGSATITNPQGVEMLGGSGRLLINGTLKVDPLYATDASYNPQFKDIRLEADLANIYGAIDRFTNGNSLEGRVYFKSPVTGQTKEVSQYINSNDDPFHSTDFPVDYKGWLTTTPNFTGTLKELNTGAQPLTALMPSLPDIDTFVDGFRTQASVTVTGVLDVPCAAGSPKSFANASTLGGDPVNGRLTTVVEVDVSTLNACGWLNGPKIMYSTVALRLVNGEQLNAPLTVVSVKAVYIKGDYNSTSPKPAAVVTGNRVYHLSSTFKDYTAFIARGSLWLADAIYNFRKDRTGYDSYLASYDPNVTLPPYATWLPRYGGDTDGDRTLDPGEETIQHLTTVSPVGKSSSDQPLTTGRGLLETWNWYKGHVSYEPKPGNNALKFTLQREGAFINLPDPDPNFLADGVTPQDHRAVRSNGSLLSSTNILTPPHHVIIYDAGLRITPPPGLTGEGSDKATQVLWSTF
jgi:hypothetical protein